MRFIALVALLILCQILPGISIMRRVACQREAYYNCEDYCRWNCQQTACLSHCYRGCGCKKAYIMLDVGGCVQLSKC